MDQLMEMMKKDGIPVTRERYISLNWGEMPEEWDAELESELPEELQDWSLFEMVGSEMVYKGPKI